MSAAAPHFLLYSEAAAAADAQQTLPGRWRFVLRPAAGGDAIQAADDEDDVSAERLELLAIVRALEALDQPSRVTLVTGSRNVRRGLHYGLPQWRDSGWQWERFGQMTPVKNGDLWRRIDRALEIHTLECRAGQLTKADDLAPPAPAPAPRPEPKVITRRTRRGRVLRIDQPSAEKSEIRNLKHETNSKHAVLKPPRARAPRRRFSHSRLGISNLIWISDFVLRVLPRHVFSALSRFCTLIRN